MSQEMRLMRLFPALVPDSTETLSIAPCPAFFKTRRRADCRGQLVPRL